jgi:tetratricopeptide (TPR) repeat protein
MMVVGHSYDIWSRPARDVAHDDAAWRALGRSTGSRIVLHGSYALSGDTLSMQAVLSDAISGNMIQAIDPVSGPRGDPLSVADRLRQRATSVMAARLNPELRNWIATAGQPTSFEAYREYADGMAAFADGRMEDAQIHFFRSAAEDTSYTLPLLWGAFALWSKGERVRRDSVIHALTSRRSSMAPLDRAIHDYLQADPNPKAEYEAARRLVQLAPGSEFQWKLAMAARDVGRPHEAIRVLQQLDHQHGWLRTFGFWTAMVETYNDLGDYGAARDILRRHAQDMNHAVVMYWEVTLAAEQGEASHVRALLLEMAAQARSIGDCSSLHRVVWMSARILRRAGRVADANQIDEWGLAFLDTSYVAKETAKDPHAAIYLKFRRAAMLSDMGRLSEAQAAFEEMDSVLTERGELARNSEPDLEVASLGYLADIALRRGDRDAAEKLRRRIIASPSPGNYGDTFMLARIAALEGHRDEAVALLAPIAMAWREHMRSDPDLDPLRSYPPFLALLKVPAE